MEEDNILGRFFDLATTNEIYVYGLNLHEIRKDILSDNTGVFEMIGSMLVGEIEQKTLDLKLLRILKPIILS